ncbi:hypothetical protein J6590_011437 [Homalodisca vitripennis]|nr:hypothetical protein J6590_011437 [Homalodisca vitripennis]
MLRVVTPVRLARVSAAPVLWPRLASEDVPGEDVASCPFIYLGLPTGVQSRVAAGNMEYLAVYLIVAGAFAQLGVCRPDLGNYIHGYQQYHNILEYPQAHHHVFPAQAHLSSLGSHSVYENGYAGHSGAHGYSHIQPYHGPIAIPVVLPSGHLADTPEVAAAKIHHLGAVAQAKADKYYSGHAGSGYGGAYGYSSSYHGYAVPVVLPNGHIADTHEVAAAKSAHLLAVAKAKAEQYYSGHGEGYGYGEAYGYSGSHHGYGIPVVLPNGHIADTPEVAHAKNAHLAAVAHAKAQEALHYDHEQKYHDDEYYHHIPLHVSHQLIHVPHQVSDSLAHGFVSHLYTPHWFSDL